MTQSIVSRAPGLGAWGTSAVAITVALAIGLGVALGGPWFAPAFAAAVIAALVLFSPELGVLFLVVQFFFLGSLVTLGYLPHAALWLPDIIIASLVLRVLALSRGGTRGLVAPRSLLVACVTLTALCLASSAINGMGGMEVLIGLRFYLKYPLLFFVLLNCEIGPRFFIRLMAGFIVIAAIQIPVSAFQYASLGGVDDANAGTMGFTGGQDLLFLALVAMTFLLTWVFIRRRELGYVLLALGMLVAPILASVRAALVFGPVAFVIVIARAISLDAKRFSATAVKVSLIAVVGVLLAAASSFLGSAIAENSFSRVGGIAAQESRGGLESTGRITAARSAASIIAGSPASTVLGYGPGSAHASRLAYGGLNQSATFRLTRHQVSATLLELGWAGIAALAVIIWMAWRITIRARFGHGEMGDAIIFSGPLVVVNFALMQGYFAAWTGGNASPLLFWLVLAAVYVIDHEPSPDPAVGLQRRGYLL